MKVKLLKAARINCQAGEIVEVSPAQAGFLFEVGAAEPLIEKREIPEAKTTRTTRTTRTKK